ncbi:MAG: hypothetical protein IPK26_20330 [Planctomycetes bacterium]|nr:hypothetical protein [Planctomycetota bacterium]
MKLLAWLGAEQRLQREVARVAGLRDPQRAVDGLRRLLPRFESLDALALRVWPALRDALLRPAGARYLTEDDLGRIRRIGVAWGVRMGDRRAEPLLCEQLAAIRAVRAERRLAARLWIEAYRHPDGDVARRGALVDCLLREGADEPAHLRVYSRELRHGVAPERRRRFEELLAQRLAAVGIEAGAREIVALVEVARELEDTGLAVAHVQTVLGLHALLIDDNSETARSRFAAALAVDPGNEVAWLGALLVGIRDRDGSRVRSLLAGRRVPATPLAAAVCLVGIAGAWLWSTDGDRGPPHPSAELVAVGDLPGIGPDVRLIVARLQLIEGDAAGAASRLRGGEVPERLRSEWRYHALWAALLCGEFDRAFRFFHRAPAAGRWVLAASILDGCNRHAGDLRVARDLTDADEPWRAAAHARAALARGESPPPPPPASCLDREGLESFRVRLGCTWSGARAGLAACLHEPAFERLPAAEREFWRGLAGLATDRRAGVASLHRAGRLGHPRADLVIAVDAVRHAETAAALAALERVPDQAGPKVASLRAQLALARGRLDGAEPDLLRSSGRTNGAACREMALLCLLRATRVFGPNAAEHARALRLEAAELLERALAGPGVVAEDTEALARCLRFAADPADGLAGAAAVWPVVAALRPALQSPFLVWYAACARLAAGSSDVPIAICRDMAQRFGERDRYPAATRLALAAIFVTAAVRADAESAGALGELALSLVDGDPDPAAIDVAERARLAAICAAYRESGDATALPVPAGNGFGAALLRACQSRRANRPADAAAALQAVDAADPGDARLAAALATLLRGDTLVVAAVPEVPVGAGPAMSAVCHVLRAAAEFQRGEPRDGLLVLLRAPGFAEQVLELRRFLPWLCVIARERPGVDGLVRQALADLRGREDAAAKELLAACELAVGNVAAALQAWQAVLKTNPTHPIGPQVQALLSHMAIQALRDGNRTTAVECLHEAARVARTAGAGAGEDLQRFADAVQAEDLLVRLLAVVFPGQTELVDTPGRLRAVARHVVEQPGLVAALRQATDARAVLAAWQASAPGRQPAVLHALAVVWRERGRLDGHPARAMEWVETGTAAWLHLLHDRTFRTEFAQRRIVDAAGERVDLGSDQAEALWTRSTFLLLQEHRQLGARALADGKPELARAHARVLVRAVGGAAAGREWLARHGIEVGDGGDEALWQGTAALAKDVIADWVSAFTAWIQGQLGLSQWFEQVPTSAPHEKALAAFSSFRALGIADKKVLTMAVHCVFSQWFAANQAEDGSAMRRTWETGKEHASALAAKLERGDAADRGNQALAWFHVAGAFTPGISAVTEAREALSWDPTNPKAREILEQRP